jgi:glycosyltransferase involved in cell wall biosynthesis
LSHTDRLITFVVPDFEPAVGGTVRQTGLQARALAQRGHRVAVLTRRVDASWPRHERIDSLEIRRLGPTGTGRARGWLTVGAVALWLRRRRRAVGVVQTVMWVNAPVASMLAGLRSRTAVLWAIDGEAATALRGGSPARRGISRVRRAVLGGCRHVALTVAMLDELREAGVGERADVIPVPVDTDHFRPPSPEERADARRELGLAEDAFVVIYVGHLQARKAVDRLLEAFRRLLGERPNARLLIVGGEPGGEDDVGEELRKQAAVPELAGQVSFCGVVEDPVRHLWASDVLVLPSSREGMPNSVLEALACGVAAVAPASAGGTQLLSRCGVVPPSNDPDDLLTALQALASDPERRAALGLEGRERVLEFDVDRVIERYERLYAEMAGAA